MLAVIVINYKNEQKTIDFVRNELSKIGIDHKIIIVNNSATADSMNFLNENLQQDNTIVLDSGGNIGFAKGNNLGARYAFDNFFKEDQKNYLLLVNNDIRFVDNNVVEVLIECLENQADAAVAGPKVKGLDGKLQSPDPYKSFAQSHLLPYWGKLFYSKNKLDEILLRNYSETASEGFHYRLMGSIMLIKAEDWKQIGGMDSGTFLYAEEPILAERFKAIGKGMWYCPRVCVIHEHGDTIKKNINLYTARKYKLDSDIYYYKTYIGTPKWQFALAKFTYFLKRLLRK